MSVTEVGRQDWQALPDVVPVPMPLQQRLDRKAMTKIVQAGTMTGGDTADADLPGQGGKGPPDLTFIQPPTPAWGSMVAEGRDVMLTAWWVSTLPGLAIVLLVLSLNVFGEGLRDILDPRLKVE